MEQRGSDVLTAALWFVQLNALLAVFLFDFKPSYSSGDWAVFPTLHGDSSTLPGYASVFLLIGQDAPGNWGSISHLCLT